MPILITGLFAPSGGADAFDLLSWHDCANHNWGAAVAPGVTDDLNAGYVTGSMWVDTTHDKAYVCLDSTVGAAVWTEITVTTGGSGSVGPAGMPGYDGEAGLDGFPGPTGAAGATGSTGATGPAGAVGQPGMDGLDGVEGMEGIPGASGASGAIGPMGPPGMDALPADELLLGLPGIPTPPVLLSEITITIPTPAANDDFTIRTFKLATTLYEVSSVIVAGTNVVFNLYHGTDRSAAGTKALTADVTETSKTTGTITGGASWADATMDAGAHLRCKVVSVSGAVTELSLTIRFYLT